MTTHERAGYIAQAQVAMLKLAGYDIPPSVIDLFASLVEAGMDAACADPTRALPAAQAEPQTCDNCKAQAIPARPDVEPACMLTGEYMKHPMVLCRTLGNGCRAWAAREGT